MPSTQLNNSAIIQSQRNQRKVNLDEQHYIPRILIVEDQAFICKLHRAWLEMLNCHVHIARSGHSALECVNRGYAYDLILMDIGLPDIDGITLSKFIRSQYHMKRIPIIAVTTQCNEVKQQCLAVGINEVLKKPINVVILRRILNRWIFQKSTSEVRPL